MSTQTEFIPEVSNQVIINESIVPNATEMRRELRSHNMEVENISHFAAEGSDDSVNEEGEL